MSDSLCRSATDPLEHDGLLLQSDIVATSRGPDLKKKPLFYELIENTFLFCTIFGLLSYDEIFYCGHVIWLRKFRQSYFTEQTNREFTCSCGDSIVTSRFDLFSSVFALESKKSISSRRGKNMGIHSEQARLTITAL
jgi:hypothetical protein